MIGNEAYALLASTMSSRSSPEGWSYIGQGSYRTTFLGPDGVVYKRQHNTDDWGDEADPFDCNRREAMIYAAHGDKTEGFRLAACTFYESCGVTAMEYADGSEAWKHPNIATVILLELVSKWCRTVELWDVCGDNIRVNSKGELIIVDYAT